MSLTLPDGFKRSSTNENWIFCLGYDDSFDMVGTSNQLDEDVNTTETEIDVDDGSLFTAGNYYRMNTIGTQVFTTGELIKVTSISSDTLTVERSLNGIENSPAQSSTTERIFNNSLHQYPLQIPQ